jgi:hypothetical protein
VPTTTSRNVSRKQSYLLFPARDRLSPINGSVRVWVHVINARDKAGFPGVVVRFPGPSTNSSVATRGSLTIVTLQSRTLLQAGI